MGTFKSECGQSGNGTLKLTILKMKRWNNLIFACWYKFRKAESWFNHFFNGLCQKWQFLFSSWDPKTYCILRVNIWIELIFLILTDIRLISYSYRLLNFRVSLQLYFLFGYGVVFLSYTICFNACGFYNWKFIILRSSGKSSLVLNELYFFRACWWKFFFTA